MGHGGNMGRCGNGAAECQGRRKCQGAGAGIANVASAANCEGARNMNLNVTAARVREHRECVLGLIGPLGLHGRPAERRGMKSVNGALEM